MIFFQSTSSNHSLLSLYTQLQSGCVNNACARLKRWEKGVFRNQQHAESSPRDPDFQPRIHFDAPCTGCSRLSPHLSTHPCISRRRGPCLNHAVSALMHYLCAVATCLSCRAYSWRTLIMEYCLLLPPVGQNVYDETSGGALLSTLCLGVSQG